MQRLPHRYLAVAAGEDIGTIAISSDDLPSLPAAPPREFDGPGDRWSPETLLVAAVASCLVLTFRAVARASGVSWTSLSCAVDGTLDHVDKTTAFTRFDIHARLTIPTTTDAGRARTALEKAERNCLISNSLKAATHLTLDIESVADMPELALPESRLDAPGRH
jgi:organic hydroperoxide reductase OsmC/OhrA